MTPFLFQCMNFYTYILESESTAMLYIGSTNNLANGITRHNSGRNKFTKNKGPWKLLFSKSFSTRAEAVQLEMELKKWKNKQRVLNWIRAQSG